MCNKKYPLPRKRSTTCRVFIWLAVTLIGTLGFGHAGPVMPKVSAWAAPAEKAPLWPHEKSDLSPDPALVFGRLDNGFRYVLLRNAHPEDRVSMHLNVQIGSAHEKESERGLAHFLEHMLFCGSEHFAPGELVAYLQSIGMQFGADANAHTGFYETVYDIFLPDGSEASLAKGLLVMQDYAQGALLLPSEIDREREVVLAEMRTRDSTSYRTFVATLAFELPDSRISKRLPIGLEAVIKQVGRQGMKAFYDDWYRPETSILVVVGDIDIQKTAAMIATRFSSFAARAPARDPIPFGRIHHQGIRAFHHYEKEAGQTSVSIEVITKIDPPKDTIQRRKERLLRDMADRMVQNRLDAVIGKGDVPGTSASIGSGVFLSQAAYGVVSAEGDAADWRRLLAVIEQHLRKALEYGFTSSELERVKKDLRSQLELAVQTRSTRDSRELARTIIRRLNADRVFLSPEQEADLLSDYIQSLDPDTVHEAFKRTWSPDHRLVLVTGNAQLASDQDAARERILEAFAESQAQRISPPGASKAVVFPYLQAPEGSARIKRRMTVSGTDIVQIDYENGLRLNIKKTDFKENEVLANLKFGRGRSAEPLAKPGLAELSTALINESGLGALEKSEIDRALAGRHTRAVVNVEQDHFVINAESTPQELGLLSQLLYHYIQDPGFTEDAYQLVMNRYRNQYEALSHTVDGVMPLFGRQFLAGGDSRFGLPPYERFRNLTLADARDWMNCQLTGSPLELSVVGDVDVDTVVALTSKHLGHLGRGACRQTQRRPNPSFPVGRRLDLVVDSDIPSAMVVVAYPTDDIWNIQRTRRLAVLADAFSERLRINIREKLGAAYSPFAYNRASSAYPGYGTFLIFVEADPAKTQFVVDEIQKMVQALIEEGITEDEMSRVLKPTLNSIKDMRQHNTYWLQTVLTGSREHPEKIAWSRTIESDYRSITTADVMRLARQYLSNERAAVIVATPGLTE